VRGWSRKRQQTNQAADLWRWLWRKIILCKFITHLSPNPLQLTRLVIRLLFKLENKLRDKSCTLQPELQWVRYGDTTDNVGNNPNKFAVSLRALVASTGPDCHNFQQAAGALGRALGLECNFRALLGAPVPVISPRQQPSRAVSSPGICRL
jgi:hypothetical protein